MNLELDCLRLKMPIRRVSQLFKLSALIGSCLYNLIEYLLPQ